jgi:hypothetical protein
MTLLLIRSVAGEVLEVAAVKLILLLSPKILVPYKLSGISLPEPTIITLF